MAIAKVIEVIAESDTSWEEAAQAAVADAGQSVRGIKHLYVKNMSAEVSGDKIVKYRLNANLTFVVED
jgi:flavin-binding protein dodecin